MTGALGLVGATAVTRKGRDNECRSGQQQGREVAEVNTVQILIPNGLNLVRVKKVNSEFGTFKHSL